MPDAASNLDVESDDPEELRTQVEQLRADLALALDAARRAEFDAGVVRGELAEMRVQLGRARQEQEWALTARSVRAARWSESLRSSISSLRARIAARLRR